MKKQIITLLLVISTGISGGQIVLGDFYKYDTKKNFSIQDTACFLGLSDDGKILIIGDTAKAINKFLEYQQKQSDDLRKYKAIAEEVQANPYVMWLLKENRKCKQETNKYSL
jgi:hypothetical protein